MLRNTDLPPTAATEPTEQPRRERAAIHGTRDAQQTRAGRRGEEVPGEGVSILRELAMEISLTSLGSSQTLPLPHLSTLEARRFCSLSDTIFSAAEGLSLPAGWVCVLAQGLGKCGGGARGGFI